MIIRCSFSGILLFVITLLLFPIIQQCEGQEGRSSKDVPRIEVSSIIPFTQKKVQLVSFAAKLSEAVYNTNDAQSIDNNVQYIVKDDDATIFLRRGSYCFVAFRGSKSPLNFNTGTLQDWFGENFDFRPYEVFSRHDKENNDNNNSCYVHRGYYKAYSGVGIDKIHTFIDDCMSSNSNRQLVLTGFSQGGAAAIVGAIINFKYDPFVITFGQPPVLQTNTNTNNNGDDKSCPLLHHRHIWRFINTENTQSRGLQYDPVRIVSVFIFCWNLFNLHSNTCNFS